MVPLLPQSLVLVESRLFHVKDYCGVLDAIIYSSGISTTNVVKRSFVNSLNVSNGSRANPMSKFVVSAIDFKSLIDELFNI